MPIGGLVILVFCRFDIFLLNYMYQWNIVIAVVLDWHNRCLELCNRFVVGLF